MDKVIQETSYIYKFFNKRNFIFPSIVKHDNNNIYILL